MDDRIKQLLRDLGTAINESISGSEDVGRHIQRIRDEGYDLYVVLDATIGLNRQDGEDSEPAEVAEPATAIVRSEQPRSAREAQFRINVDDLSLLRSLGIDPTRKVKSLRRIEPIGHDEQQ